ncbi:MAG TPA: AbrB/MazE/SpoVT family DNA-binding domain-containing protein [Anaerolineae bacterium]|nr:AbrB/MazE/SpoVT family DNA-binding domain-containing protein [Anaerolineae bacterium]
MTVVVKSSEENTIAIPAHLMEALNLREGEEVKAIVDGETLRLARLGKFLGLRGALAGDEAFDRALELNDQAWRAWTTTPSA